MCFVYLLPRGYTYVGCIVTMSNLICFTDGYLWILLLRTPWQVWRMKIIIIRRFVVRIYRPMSENVVIILLYNVYTYNIKYIIITLEIG